MTRGILLALYIDLLSCEGDSENCAERGSGRGKTCDEGSLQEEAGFKKGVEGGSSEPSLGSHCVTWGKREKRWVGLEDKIRRRVSLLVSRKAVSRRSLAVLVAWRRSRVLCKISGWDADYFDSASRGFDERWSRSRYSQSEAMGRKEKKKTHPFLTKSLG